MSTHVANYLLTDAALAGSATLTSEPIRIEKAAACSIQVQSIAGTAKSVTFTYTLSNAADGTFVPGEAAIAGLSVNGVSDWIPEVASWMKVTITNATANNLTALKVILAVQED